VILASSRPLLALRFTPLSLPHLPISLPNFLPCFPSFPLVTCRRHSPYLTPCATSTCYRAISHHHDSPSATPPSALYIQPMYLLYLVRFELVGLYTACTSHIPLPLRPILHYCASVPWCCDRLLIALLLPPISFYSHRNLLCVTGLYSTFPCIGTRPARGVWCPQSSGFACPTVPCFMLYIPLTCALLGSPFSGLPDVASCASSGHCIGNIVCSLALVPIFPHTRTEAATCTCHPSREPVATAFPRAVSDSSSFNLRFMLLYIFSCIVMWLCSYFGCFKCLPMVLQVCVYLTSLFVHTLAVNLVSWP